MESWLIFDIVIAFVLDLIVGDPYWMPHPVRVIGSFIKKSEKILERLSGHGAPDKTQRNPGRELAAGVLLTGVTVAASFFCVWVLVQTAKWVHPVLYHLANIYFIYSALAAKCLAKEASKVYAALKSGDLVQGRKQLSMLVGRHTENLDEQGILRGVVETTAENTVDGVLSPLFYVLLGSLFGLGAPLVYAFKAVSTLDSMVGYRNERYLYFGRASARLDDAANYIPARLSSLVLPVSAFLYGKGFKRSFRVMWRDRHNHKSPNCAYPEAAVAGALGIQLGGTNVYFGVPVEKPTIGDRGRELRPKDIRDTIHLMYLSSLVTLMVGIGAVLIIRWFFI